ncbi:Frizzled-4 [Frankliniella fusca]|uniref:Frizzled-4 n=1 Tax=Frankliniella fusca TaxID=407009 RepID=A0AAE1LIV7_9NEOP|nr:Frizzled-4 [Frankliniella fusca]
MPLSLIFLNSSQHSRSLGVLNVGSTSDPSPSPTSSPRCSSCEPGATGAAALLKEELVALLVDSARCSGGAGAPEDDDDEGALEVPAVRGRAGDDEGPGDAAVDPLPHHTPMRPPRKIKS